MPKCDRCKKQLNDKKDLKEVGGGRMLCAGCILKEVAQPSPTGSKMRRPARPMARRPDGMPPLERQQVRLSCPYCGKLIPKDVFMTGRHQCELLSNEPGIVEQTAGEIYVHIGSTK